MTGHGAEFDRQRRERLAAFATLMKGWRRWSREMERALDRPQSKANESPSQLAARRRRGR